jgi:small redox-active disulfide protein 2
MKKIQILGMGCQKCNRLQELSEQAANELGIEYTVEKVKDMKRIMDFGVMVTPALVVDGVVKVAGKVPSLDEIKKIIGPL